MNQDTTRRTAQRVAAAALASAFTAMASAATPGSAAPDLAATDVTGKVTVDALAMSPRSLQMGKWSDGTDVKPMRTGTK